MFALHLLAIVEKESLHWRCRLAPPQWGDDDEVVIDAQVGCHWIDGRVAVGVVGLGFNRIQQLSTQCISIGIILQSLLGWLYLQYIRFDESGQGLRNLSAVARIAIECHQSLAAFAIRGLCPCLVFSCASHE